MEITKKDKRNLERKALLVHTWHRNVTICSIRNTKTLFGTIIMTKQEAPKQLVVGHVFISQHLGYRRHSQYSHDL